MNGRRAVLGGVVVLAAVAAGYLFWKNCVVALKPSHGDDASLAKGPVRAATARSGRIDRGLISLYFEDWGIRFKEGEIVRTPARLTANAPVKLALAISQNNAVGVKITYVLVAFSTNAEGYPGAGNRGRSWQKTGRQDANEYVAIVKETLPARSSLRLPPLDVIFKAPGYYDMNYAITVEGEEASQGRCVFHIV